MTTLPPDREPPLPESIWNLLRQDEPDPRAIQAAYYRFAARRPKPVSAFKVVRWLALGFVAGGSVALAATGTARLRERLWPAHLAARGAEAKPAPATPSSVAPASRATASAPSPDVSSLPAPNPPSDALHPTSEAPRAVLPEPSPTDPKWQRAAAALKTRNYPAAESALREVETTGAPGDRDAASLALAQVLLTRGRVVEARARLERLSQRAGSTLVRDKARALLAEISSSGGRSPAAPSVPQ